jgi:hypothetical protein
MLVQIVPGDGASLLYPQRNIEAGIGAHAARAATPTRDSPWPSTIDRHMASPMPRPSDFGSALRRDLDCIEAILDRITKAGEA